MKKKKWIWLCAAACVVLCGIGYWYYEQQTDKKVSYVLGEARKSTIGMTIDATGTIEPVNMVDLSATASGTLEKVLVNQNDRVRQGQTLAIIASEALTSTMRQMENTLSNKESYYHRLYDLYTKGAISYQQMDDARLDYLNAQAAYDKAKADVNDTVVVSPLNGYVIGEPMKVGETVSQGLSNQMVIMTVADLSQMQIKLLVDETDIGEVRTGQKVSFTVDAYPNRTFHGVISNISRKEYSEVSGSSSVIYYTVYVDIDSSDLEGLYPSMTARAEIQGRENQNAVVVPTTALRSDTKGAYVYVKKDTETNPQKTYVDVGITTDTEVEILSGVSEGDSIVISGSVEQEQTAEPTNKIKPRGF